MLRLMGRYARVAGISGQCSLFNGNKYVVMVTVTRETVSVQDGWSYITGQTAIADSHCRQPLDIWITVVSDFMKIIIAML